MLLELDYLSIGKRDADCYDVYYRQGIKAPMTPGEKRVAEGRVAALRAEYTEDDKGHRTATPGTWRIRWEHGYEKEGDPSYRQRARDLPEGIEALKFGTVHEAFAFYCAQVLV